MISFQNLPKELVDQKQDLINWLKDVCGSYGVSIGELLFVWHDNEHIQDLNNRFLHHDYPTDVITFNYSNNAKLSGEAHMGLEVIKQNSDYYEVQYVQELHRVIAHAVLHLIGFDDKIEEDFHQMKIEEDNCLLLRPNKLKTS